MQMRAWELGRQTWEREMDHDKQKSTEGFERNLLNRWLPVWPDKNRQMSIKVAQNGFTRKMNDFDTFTKIA